MFASETPTIMLSTSMAITSIFKLNIKSSVYSFDFVYLLRIYFYGPIPLRHRQSLAANLHLVDGAALHPVLGKQVLHLRPGAPLLRYHSHEASAAGSAKSLGQSEELR